MSANLNRVDYHKNYEKNYENPTTPELIFDFCVHFSKERKHVHTQRQDYLIEDL